MENLNPFPDPEDRNLRPENMPAPDMEVLHPITPPEPDKLQAVRRVWAKVVSHVVAITRTRWGKWALAAVAALIIGGIVLQMLPRKSETPGDQVQVSRSNRSQGRTVQKSGSSSKNKITKATKKSSKTKATKKKSPTKKTSSKSKRSN